jgi:Flp pilus assembly protein TadD
VDAPKPEFYDLIKDPGETTNLLQTHRKEAAEMKARIAQLISGTERAQGAPEISAQTRALLGSLGYTASGKRITTSGADPKDMLGEEEDYEHGLALLYTSDYAAAIRVLSLVAAKDPRNLPARCALGDAHFRSGDEASARRLWQQAPPCMRSAKP